MSEWLKEHAWKVCIRQRIEGSNPSLSAMNKAPNLGAFFVVMDKHDDNPAQKLLGMQRNNSV